MPHHCYLHNQLLCKCDPTAIGAYELGILPLIKFLLEFVNLDEINAREVAFANNFSVTGSLNSIKDYWDKLTTIGPRYGYFPKSKKSYLIVKEKKLLETQNIFANSQVNITAEGKRYPVAVIGSTEYRDKYVKNLVKDWHNQRTILSTIAKAQPQAAYLAYVNEFKNKLNCFLRNIPNIHHLLLSLERKIKKSLSQLVTGGHICHEKGRVLIFLPTRYG